MAVTAATVARWAKQPVPVDDELEVLDRLILAVGEEAIEHFGLDPEEAEWTARETQAVIEVVAEQWIGGRNSQFGTAEFDDGPALRTNSIPYGLKRRLQPVIGFG